MANSTVKIGVFCASPVQEGNSMAITDEVMSVLEGTSHEVVRLNMTEIQDKVEPWPGGDYLPEGESSPEGVQAFIDFAEDIDAMIIISPIYFSSPPAQFKAVIDSLQPLWSARYLDGTRPEGTAKPLLLLMPGGGPDPYGYQPMITIVQSGMELFDFRLTEMLLLKGYRVEGNKKTPEQFEQQAREKTQAFVDDLESGAAQDNAAEAARGADPRRRTKK